MKDNRKGDIGRFMATRHTICKLIKQGKPKVDGRFIMTWDANITTGISEGISLKRMLKDMLEAAGVEVGQ